MCVCVFVFLQTGTLLFRRSSPSVNIKLHNKKHRFLIQYLSWFCASKSKEVTSTKTTQQIRTKNIRISILRKHVTLTNQPNINYINALLSGKLRWLAGKRTLKWKMYSLLKNADLQASHVSLPTQPSCTLIREFLQNYIHLYTRNICCLFDPPKYVAFNDTLCNHLFFFCQPSSHGILLLFCLFFGILSESVTEAKRDDLRMQNPRFPTFFPR